MTAFILIYIVLCTRFVNLLSAEPEISVSGPVGSTAVLPCQLTSVNTDRLYIRWSTESESVFERKNGEKYVAEGYEGRVDVPVEELRKGNCSLVFHNLTFTDTGVYTSYQIMRRTNGSPDVKMINSVKLSVHNRTEETPDINTDSSAPTQLKTRSENEEKIGGASLWDGGVSSVHLSHHQKEFRIPQFA